MIISSSRTYRLTRILKQVTYPIFRILKNLINEWNYEGEEEKILPGNWHLKKKIFRLFIEKSAIITKENGRIRYGMLAKKNYVIRI